MNEKHQCSICNGYFSNSNRFIRHIKLKHKNDPRFSIRCSLCGKTFKVFRTFYRHLKNHESCPLSTTDEMESNEEIYQDTQADVCEGM